MNIEAPICEDCGKRPILYPNHGLCRVCYKRKMRLGLTGALYGECYTCHEEKFVKATGQCFKCYEKECRRKYQDRLWEERQAKPAEKKQPAPKPQKLRYWEITSGEWVVTDDPCDAPLAKDMHIDHYGLRASLSLESLVDNTILLEASSGRRYRVEKTSLVLL